MACDHGMMLMSDHDDAYVDAMLMVNMQAITRSVTISLCNPYVWAFLPYFLITPVERDKHQNLWNSVR